MRVCFRADTAPRIGMGHLMRCLTLADVAASTGAQVDFISRQHAQTQAAHVRERGHRLAWLPFSPAFDLAATTDGGCDYRAWLGESPATDATQTAQLMAARGQPPDWLVVDHYGVDPQWEQVLRSHCKRLMVLDDFAGRPHACDLLLNQSLMDGAGEGGLPHQLLGPSYALLRPEFAQAHQRARQRQEAIFSVLVAFGGSDPEDFTTAAVEAAVAALPGARIAVVLGANYANSQALQRRWSDDGRVGFHVNSDKVCELMEWADLGIGAAGGMTWERCAVGLPSIAVPVVANQEGIAQGVQRAGAAMVVQKDQATSAGMARAITELTNAPGKLKSLSRAALRLVDGMGAHRVWTRMMEVA